MSSVSLVSGSTSCSSGRLRPWRTRSACCSSEVSQVDHETALVQRLAILRQQDGAAAGREHDRALARHVFDDLAFALAKAVLALAREDVRDVDAGARFDFRIAVAKWRAQQARQVLAHGGLARAHGADQEYIGICATTFAMQHSGNEAAARRRPLSKPI